MPTLTEITNDPKDFFSLMMAH
uniref:Uncharacterized protein n=1 Tax=Arundo donax TaxID=35708 RepID=A0A0A8YFJ6_ARUDO